MAKQGLLIKLFALLLLCEVAILVAEIVPRRLEPAGVRFFLQKRWQDVPKKGSSTTGIQNIAEVIALRSMQQ